MTKGRWIPIAVGVISAIAAIYVAYVVSKGQWPAGKYEGNMLQAGATVAGALFVIAVFLERAMAVVNDILFGAETVDLENKARMQLIAEDPDLPITEYEQKLLDENKKRMRLAGSFLTAVFIAAAGARSLGALFSLENGPGGMKVADQNAIFLVMDVLLTAGVLAGGSSGIAAIIDLLRKRVDAAKAQQESQLKAGWVGVRPSALQGRYQRAGFKVHEIQLAPQRTALGARQDLPAVDEADDAAAHREWRQAEPDAAAAMLQIAAKDWRIAKALEKLRSQLDASFPNRNKASDGTIGDNAHCGTNPASSDHCPNIPDGNKWVVTAFDATHDPAHHCDMDVVTKKVIDSRDTRIKYIIWNKRICASYPVNDTPAWEWRDYTGASPHDKHAHFSVLSDKQYYDDQSNWTIA